MVSVTSVNTNADVGRNIAIGEDSTTTAITGMLTTGRGATTWPASQPRHQFARFRGFPAAIGYHYYTWLEYSIATGTTTWYGDTGDAASEQSGMEGLIYS